MQKPSQILYFNIHALWMLPEPGPPHNSQIDGLS